MHANQGELSRYIIKDIVLLPMKFKELITGSLTGKT